MAPLANRFLGIPEDIRIRILLALDNVSLLRCKLLCHGIRALINTTIELEYKLALARAGRVELNQSPLSISDRLRALRTLDATVSGEDTMPFIQLPDEVTPHWPGVADGFIPYLANNKLDLVLWRPALPLYHTLEEKRIIPAVSKSHAQAVIGALAADISQDLLVFSRPARPEIPPECHVFSITEGRSHPDVAGANPFRIVFEPVFTEGGFNTIENLQIFGDVIAWSITDDKHSAVHIWNWKTSVLVWHQQSCARGSCCRVISPSHVVLVTAQAVSVYTFDSSADRPPQPASLETALCILELPRLKSFRFEPYVRVYMQFPPSAPAQTGESTPAFGLDPSLTVLTITLLQSLDVKSGVRSERYAIFVPLSTLFARIRPSSTLIAKDTRRRTVPWADWGPGGARIVRFKYISHISVMGSRCAFMLNEGYSGTINVVLFDVRRGAGDESTRERLENLCEDLFDVRETMEYTLAFAEEIRTTFPIEIVHMALGARSGYLLQDAVAISHEAWGGQAALGDRWYDPDNWL